VLWFRAVGARRPHSRGTVGRPHLRPFPRQRRHRNLTGDESYWASSVLQIRTTRARRCR
jgi:hypothetical protein